MFSTINDPGYQHRVYANDIEFETESESCLLQYN